MQVQEYIKSGILEEYCLGLLTAGEQQAVLAMSTIYPEVKKDLQEIEYALERYAFAAAIDPAGQLKQRIIASVNPVVTLANLPATNKYSDHQAWLAAVEHLIPAQPFDDFFAHRLRTDDTIEQTLVVTRLGVPQETHNDVVESFFILHGHCVCTVGHRTYNLSPGDFLEIPLKEEHDVRLLSDHVVAILQHQMH